MKFNPHFTVLSDLKDTSNASQRRLGLRGEQRPRDSSDRFGEYTSASVIEQMDVHSDATSPAWCSTPEFCVFLSHNGVCPPPPAAA